MGGLLFGIEDGDIDKMKHLTARILWGIALLFATTLALACGGCRAVDKLLAIDPPILRVGNGRFGIYQYNWKNGFLYDEEEKTTIERDVFSYWVDKQNKTLYVNGFDGYTVVDYGKEGWYQEESIEFLHIADQEVFLSHKFTSYLAIEVYKSNFAVARHSLGVWQLINTKTNEVIDSQLYAYKADGSLTYYFIGKNGLHKIPYKQGVCLTGDINDFEEADRIVFEEMQTTGRCSRFIVYASGNAYCNVKTNPNGGYSIMNREGTEFIEPIVYQFYEERSLLYVVGSRGFTIFDSRNMTYVNHMELSDFDAREQEVFGNESSFRVLVDCRS